MCELQNFIEINLTEDRPHILFKNVALQDLRKLLQNLQECLSVLSQLMPFLIHFHMNKSHLFLSYMKSRTIREDCLSIDEFKTILYDAYMLFQTILEGSAQFRDMEWSESQAISDIEKEFDTAIQFFSSRMQVEIDIVKHYKNLMTLLSLYPCIMNSHKVCKIFQLQNCLQDKSFQQLLSLSLNLSNDQYVSDLQIQNATTLMDNFFKWVGLEDTNVNKWKYPYIIQILAESDNFYCFLLDNNFFGDGGQAHFHQQFRLVTQQLQGEEYQQEVLSHLPVAYNFILNFVEHTGNFCDFFNKVNSCNDEHLLELKNVNHNIDSLQLWFSRIEVSIICH